MNEFGVQYNKAYGSFGEFNIKNKNDSLRVQFILTKIKPGNEGHWENELASSMIPWREVFDIEELTFEELVQRDLDDSRVAHELIPYLIGETGATARFFPPILSVIVPKKEAGTGIKSFYPEPSIDKDNRKEKYGDLFSFEQMKWDDNFIPLASIGYNPHQSAFVIVDGQHRAMAILALHRQLNGDWGSNPYASYYKHIKVDRGQLKKIELPVCLLYFPDITENNKELRIKGTDLKTVCREIFLIVNRNAKPVSASRELLLDDDDIAACLMRTTLSKLKGRDENNYKISRVYSYSYSDESLGKQVVTGQIEYSSAMALYKMHSAMSFGIPDAFNWENSPDISNINYCKNPSRPATIILGTDIDDQTSISKNSARTLGPNLLESLTKLLSGINDFIILKLFDDFFPFQVHNKELRKLKDRLFDPNIKSDPYQNKYCSLLYEGSGIRDVFEEHQRRQFKKKERKIRDGEDISYHLNNQIDFCKSISSALDKNKKDFKQRRACTFFSINFEEAYKKNVLTEKEKERLESASKCIFSTVSTQAFQLGFVMAIHTVVETMINSTDSYDKRKDCIEEITILFIETLNEYFGANVKTIHKKLKGFINEPMSDVFDTSRYGYRGFLSMIKPELNEKTWDFFRYAISELVFFSQKGNKVIKKYLNADSKVSIILKEYLSKIIKGIIINRNKFIEKAKETALKTNEFKLLLAEAKGKGRSDDEIEKIEKKEINKKQKEIEKRIEEHLKASLGKITNENDIIKELEL